MPPNVLPTAAPRGASTPTPATAAPRVYSAPAGDSKLAALFAMLAAVALGRAVQLGDGMYTAAAIPFLAAAQAASLGAVMAPRFAWLERAAGAVTLPVGLLALGWQVAQLLTFSAPAKYLVLRGPADHLGFAHYLSFVAVLGAAFAAAPASRRLWTSLALGLGAAAAFGLWGHWLIAHSPDPDMDVVMFHRQAVPELLQGHNPHAMHFDFPRGNPAGYPPGMAVGGKLLFGYPYMPLGLLLSVPGHLAGDYRYSLLGALLAAAALLAALGWRRHGPLAAALLLCTPRVLYFLELGWTEPYCLVLLACALAAARWRPAWVPASVGLLACSKQYLPVALGTAALLPALSFCTRAGRAAWVRALAWAVAVTGPFVVVSPTAFWRSVVQVQLSTPLRADALNYSAWAQATHKLALAPAWGGVLAAAVLLLCGFRAPRTPMGFALGLGAVLQAFLAINRQAFGNYYLLVMGAYLAALATCAPITGPLSAASPADTPPRPAAAKARPRRR